MELWMLCFFWVTGGGLAGFIFGFGLKALLVKRKKPIGTLRLDRSDPNEAPYLFLELERGGMDRIYSDKTVIFKVDLNSYLPRN